MYAKRRQQMQPKGGSTTSAEVDESIEEPVSIQRPAAVPDMWTEPPSPEPIQIRFSMRTLLIAMTIAAVSFGMIRILGGPGPTATILGFMAVAGLLVHAIGVEPPQSVVLVWWLVLALYVVLTIVGAI